MSSVSSGCRVSVQHCTFTLFLLKAGRDRRLRYEIAPKEINFLHCDGKLSTNSHSWHNLLQLDRAHFRSIVGRDSQLWVLWKYLYELGKSGFRLLFVRVYMFYDFMVQMLSRLVKLNMRHRQMAVLDVKRLAWPAAIIRSFHRLSIKSISCFSYATQGLAHSHCDAILLYVEDGFTDLLWHKLSRSLSLRSSFPSNSWPVSDCINCFLHPQKPHTALMLLPLFFAEGTVLPFLCKACNYSWSIKSLSSAAQISKQISRYEQKQILLNCCLVCRINCLLVCLVSNHVFIIIQRNRHAIHSTAVI